THGSALLGVMYSATTLRPASINSSISISQQFIRENPWFASPVKQNQLTHSHVAISNRSEFHPIPYNGRREQNEQRTSPEPCHSAAFARTRSVERVRRNLLLSFPSDHLYLAGHRRLTAYSGIFCSEVI